MMDCVKFGERGIGLEVMLLNGLPVTRTAMASTLPPALACLGASEKAQSVIITAANTGIARRFISSVPSVASVVLHITADDSTGQPWPRLDTGDASGLLTVPGRSGYPLRFCS